MLRALLWIVVLSLPRAVFSQSFVEEAVSGLLGRTSRIGRNMANLASGQQRTSGVNEFFDLPKGSSVVLRPQDGTVLGGFVRGLMADVDNNGNVNKATVLHPDQQRLVGALIGGLASGRASTPRPTTPPPEEEQILGIIESMARRRKTRLPDQELPEPVKPAVTEAPVKVTTAAAIRILADQDDGNPVPGVLDEFRRDVQRDAPECSEKAKAQLSKVLSNFRKGVLDCVGVEDADLGDVLNRLRQVLLTADRLPTSLFANLQRCSAAAANRTSAAAPAASEKESSAITRIPPRRRQGQPGEVSAARCVLLALADARDRLHTIPSETAAFSRRVAFLLAGTRSDARVRACVASQLTSMAHPIVATARQMAACVTVGPEFTIE